MAPTRYKTPSEYPQNKIEKINEVVKTKRQKKMISIMRRDPMDSTIRSNIKIGQTVKVIQKQDQRTGKQTEGVVERILTNSSNHPRGIKVKLEGGIVGRVCEIKG